MVETLIWNVLLFSNMHKNYNFCQLNRCNNLDFSLDDYRNNYFTSKDHDKILDFYNSFTTRDEIIDWMKRRPEGNCSIIEVGGNKDVIVVIPTMDADSKLARNCKENIFKGLHIIFVESGYDNLYFNYAHNCNIGIRRAMEYNPKWVVISNDDMYQIDKVEILLNKLSLLDNNQIFMVLTKEPGLLHSLTEHLGESTPMRRFLTLILPKTREKYQIEKKFNLKFVSWRDWYRKWLTRLIYRELTSVRSTYAFGIFSGNYILKSGPFFFDEIYQNGYEDIDISLSTKIAQAGIDLINYRIGSYSATSLGTGEFRILQEIANRIHFESKFMEQLYKIHEEEALNG